MNKLQPNRTLANWLTFPGADKYAPIMAHDPLVGIHDVWAIDHVRTYLWDLSDYVVTAVQAGVIWLAPRERGANHNGTRNS